MGLLTAFMQGAAQGLNVYGQGMLRDIAQEDEQALWNKRQKLLAELQRESRKVDREDQAAFDAQQFPVRVEQESQLTAARVDAQIAGDVKRANSPELQAAESARAARELERRIEEATKLATDPRIAQAEREKAQRQIDADKLRLEQLAPVEAKRAGMISAATARGAEAGRSRETLAGKLTEIEEVIGRPLTQQEREGFAGLKKTDDGMQKWIRSLVEEDIKAGNITADKAPQRMQEITDAFRAQGQDTAIASGVAQARKDGKVAEAVEELRSRGFSDEQLSKWFSPAELQKAAEAKKKAGGGAPSRGPSPLGTMFDHTASKIATDSYIRRTQGR